jgi:peptidoglycan/LPS O-acetylase OafA/YrhL
VKERFIFLDGLRGVAAMMVVIYHFTDRTSNPLLQNAYFAVDLFFVLSGFVITKAYSERIQNGMLLTAFIAMRLKRLYPMFLAGLVTGGMALCLIAFRQKTDMSSFDILISMIVNAAYLPYLFPSNYRIGEAIFSNAAFPVNPPAWTLFFEFYVNLIFFWLWRSSYLTTLRLFLIFFAALQVYFELIYTDLSHWGWGTSPLHLFVGLNRTIYGFAGGVLIASLPKIKLSSKYMLAVASFIVIAFCLTCALPHGRDSFFFAVLLAPILVWAGSHIVLGPVTSRIAAWMGELSYPLYCIHFPILLAASSFHFVQGIVWPLVFAAASVFVAFCFSRYFEKPIRQTLEKKVS